MAEKLTKSGKPRKRRPYEDTSWMLMPDGTKKPILTIKCDEYGNKTVIHHMDEEERLKHVKKIMDNNPIIIPV